MRSESSSSVVSTTVRSAEASPELSNITDERKESECIKGRRYGTKRKKVEPSDVHGTSPLLAVVPRASKAKDAPPFGLVS